MIKVVVLGSGNMAWHLCKVFTASKGIEVVQHYHYNSQGSIFKNFGISFTNNLKNLKKADFYILAVADDAIAKLSINLPVLNGIVLHTSGTVAIKDLETKNQTGVFYPLQTLSKNQPVDFTKIPICIEAINSSDLEKIKLLASQISTTVVEMSSDKRAALHLAAVFANNFVNHLYKQATDICRAHNIEMHLLDELITETALKAIKNTPEESQTGPAKRGDKKTISKHLNMLSEDTKKIYKTLSDSLLENYGREKL